MIFEAAAKQTAEIIAKRYNIPRTLIASTMDSALGVEVELARLEFEKIGSELSDEYINSVIVASQETIASTIDSLRSALRKKRAEIMTSAEKLFPAKFSHFPGLTCQNCGSKIEKGLNECQMCGERRA